MRNSAQLAAIGLAVSAVLSAASPSVMAADRYWQGTTNNNWSVTTNWLGFTPPGAADNAYFDISGGLPPVRSGVNLDNANRTVANLYVLGDTPVGQYTFTRTGSPVLTVSNETQVGSSSGGASTTTFTGFALNTSNLEMYGLATAVINGGSVFNVSNLLRLNGTNTLNVSGSTVTAAQLGLLTASQMNVANAGVVNTGSAVQSEIGGTSKLTIGNGGTFNAGHNLIVFAGEVVVDPGSTLSVASGRTLGALGGTSKITLNRAFTLSNGALLQANAGGDIVASSYVDIGNANTGSLSIDGVGTTLTTAGTTASDWGSGGAGSFSGQITNSAAANVSTLNLGANNGTASLSLTGNGSLTVGTFAMGGGTSVRNVGMTINGGVVTANGNATFNNRAVVNLQSGTLAFAADATFSAGSTLNRTGGTLTTTGIFLNVAGGTYNRNGVGTELSNASALRITAGGQSTGTSFYDIANSNTTGTLLVDGAGSLFTAGGGSVSDWGRGTGRTATVTLSNSGQATLNNLQIGTNNAASTVSITSSATLNTAGTLLVGGGTTARTVALNVAGGTLTTAGLATLDSQAVLTLGSGTVNFNNGATILTGGTLSRTGGSLNIASGKNLDVTGGTFARSSASYELSNGATLRVLSGGQSTGSNFLDIANSNTTGGLTIDGTGTLFTAGSLSDWGRGPGHSATVAISNAAQANVTSTGDSLRFGTNNAAATVVVSGTATLSTAGSLYGGGGSTARTVALKILGGNLTTAGPVTLDNKVAMELGTSGTTGTVNFNGGATLLPGSSLNWSGGTLSVAAGKTLDVSGGTFTRTTDGGIVSTNSTFAVTNGGTATTAEFLDITTATLNVANAGSSLTVGGGFYSDWALSSGQTTTVNLTDGGVATYNSGLHMGVNGGTTNLTVNTGGRLVASALVAGGNGATNISVNNPPAASAGISVTGTTTLGANTTVTLASGRLAFNQLTMSGNAKILPAATTSVGTINVGVPLNLGGTSKIDLGRGSLIVGYSGGTPIEDIRDYLLSGYNGGDWLGNGITSSAAAAVTTLGIYYGDTGSQVTVRATLYGDADGDGGVSINDFNALAGSFGQSGKFWSQGDFDYDGGVSINDFNRLAGNFGKTLASLSDGPNFAALALWGFAVAHNDEAAFIAATGVPEPTGLAALAVGGIAAVRRRRR